MKEKPRSAGQVLLIPSDSIYPNPNQPRKVFDQSELVNLAISIRMNGILQPITVREIENGYELVSGERRLRASKLAGLLNVPCIVVDVNSLKSAVFALIENLQRQNLGYFEEAQAINKLMKDFSLSQDEAARRLGKAPSTVSNKLRLLSLPEEAREKLSQNGLSERHARALLRIDDEELRKKILSQIISEGFNATEAENYISDFLHKNTLPDKKQDKKFIVKDLRIFVNTINKAVDTMRLSGINAIAKRVESEEYIEYTVKIPKSEAIQGKTA